MPEFAESLGAVRKRESLSEQYGHVLRIDQKMRCLGKMPLANITHHG